MLASEVQQKAAEAGLGGFCRAREGSGRVVFEAPGQSVGPPPELVFARATGRWIAEVEGLVPGQRVERVLEALPGPMRVQETPRVDAPDTDAGRELGAFCRKFRGALTRALQPAADPDGDELWCLFPDSTRALIALRTPGVWPLHWPAGIPRLKKPGAAPSRSVLKLEEALHRLVPDAWAPHSGGRAVDLGAAPGGWTWLLRRRGLQVIAVDPQRLKGDLSDDPGVEHHRADAFTYQPPAPVDWLVCDMVERPQRVAPLMARWLAEGWTRRTVFNLKLPMADGRHGGGGDPLPVIERTRTQLLEAGAEVCTASQLYHDRDEVTVFAARPPSG